MPWRPPEPREECPFWGLGQPHWKALLQLLVSQTPLEGTAHLPFNTTRMLLPSLISELHSQTDTSPWEMDWSLLPEVLLDSQTSLVICSPNNWNGNISDKHCCTAREPEVFPMYLCLLLVRENIQDAEDQTSFSGECFANGDCGCIDTGRAPGASCTNLGMLWKVPHLR